MIIVQVITQLHFHADSVRRRKFNRSACLIMSSLFIVLPAAAAEPSSFAIKPHEVPEPCDAKVAQVRVTVNNVRAGGVLNVELYDDPEHFLFKKGRKRKVRVPAAEGRQKVCMTLNQPGTYAVAVYHDRDGDRKLKKHWNLLPREPFGLSNNPDNQDGFPKFSDSAFTASSLGADIVVNLREPAER